MVKETREAQALRTYLEVIAQSWKDCEEWIVRWIVVTPFITPLSRFRRKKIMEGITISSLEVTVNNEDTHPDINMNFMIISQTVADLNLKSITLCIRSGQWEFARVYATPDMDDIPSVIKNRKVEKVNVRLDPPLKWWLEYRSNINIHKVILEVSTSWGNLKWNVNIIGCSVNIHNIDGVCNRYLSRIGLKREGNNEL